MYDFQPGDRIRLVHTDDEHTRLRPGDEGTVMRQTDGPWGPVVDVKWDSGSTLSMVESSGDVIEKVSL